MNALSNIRRTERAAVAIANARKLAKALEDYANEVARRMDQGTQRAMFAELEVCNAAIRFCDDGDFAAQRDVLCQELGCDEDGLPFGCERSDAFWRESQFAEDRGLR